MPKEAVDNEFYIMKLRLFIHDCTIKYSYVAYHR